MKINTLAIIVIVSFMGITGCTNSYTKFYHDSTGGVDILKLPNVIVSTDEPKVIKGNNKDSDLLQMLEDGYDLIGYSSFNGKVNEDDVLVQAKNVHASTVLVYSQYTNTVSSFVPLTIGMQTTYIPNNTNRSDYFASYWIKSKPGILGVHLQELTAELRQKNKTNKGVFVQAVEKTSPAFLADIFRGDILKKIGNIEITDIKNCSEAIGLQAGKKTTVAILREGNEIEKEIVFNNKP